MSAGPSSGRTALPVEIGVLRGQLPVNWGQLFAFGVLMVTPVLVVFLVADAGSRTAPRRPAGTDGHRTHLRMVRYMNRLLTACSACAAVRREPT